MTRPHSKHYAGFDADIARDKAAREHAAKVVEDWIKQKELDHAHLADIDGFLKQFDEVQKRTAKSKLQLP